MNLSGYIGFLGFVDYEAITPSNNQIPMLQERRYQLIGYGAREIDSEDNTFSPSGYGFLVHDQAHPVELDTQTATRSRHFVFTSSIATAT